MRARCGTMASMATDSSDIWIERHVALGLVVTFGAQMEELLRACFLVLDGGDYADVVAAGQDVGWLVRYCRDLTKANCLLDQACKDAIGDALKLCMAAIEHRNELIHGVHYFPSGSLWGFIERSRRHKPALARDLMLSDIQDVGQELSVAADELLEAVTEALPVGVSPAETVDVHVEVSD